MKILTILSSASRNAGGLFESVRRLTIDVNKSFQNKVISFEDEFSWEDSGKWSNIEVETYKSYGPKGFCYNPKIYSAISNYAPDIIHIHGIWGYYGKIVRDYSYDKNIPYLISPHGMLDPWALRNSSYKKKIAMRWYEYKNIMSADVVRALCVSEAMAIKQISEKISVEIVPNSLDLSAIPLVQINRTNPENRKIRNLLFLGRLHPKKNIINLLKAWRMVSTGKNWNLTIAGWDELNHEFELHKTASNLGLLNEVYFVGPKHGVDKYNLFANSDAFILPSLSEGLPMAILEAWAMKLPVVMTPQCNLPSGFECGAAIKIETNIESIAEGLEILMSKSHIQLNEMGKAGFENVKNNFDNQIINKKITKLYNKIIDLH